MGIRIVTDSTCDLPKDIVEKHDITVVPLRVSWGSETYRDGVDFTPAEFFRRLETSEQLPTTSQPAVGDFAEVYRRLTGAGHSIISIHISSKLSGTHHAALLARDMVGGDIQVVDSGNVSLGLGLQVLEAARAAVSGTKEEVLRAVQSAMRSMRLICCLRTLEYLRKGGRIGDLAALVGTLLNIKPLIAVEKGCLVSTERARGFRQAVLRMVDSLAASMPKGAQHVVGVMHAATRETAEWLQEEVLKRIEPLEIYVIETGAVIGTHAGPGAVGLAAFSK